jgi:cytochrome P450/nitrite reductase/ring-hydroxylating ferredoxin subunit
MPIASFTHVAKVAELAGPGPFTLSANGVDLAVVRTRLGWRAYEGRCPHRGALLGEGEIEEGHLVCRNHGWRFGIDSGQRTGGPECLASCPIVERNGAIFANVSGLKQGAENKKAGRKWRQLPGPMALPFLGNLHQLEPRSVHLVLERWAALHGSAYTFKLGRTRAIAVSDPHLIDHVLRDRPEAFRRSRRQDRILTETGTRGVFNAEGDVWRPQRKLTVAALSQRHLRQVYPHIQTVAGRLHRRWRGLASAGADIDIVEDLKRFTVDVTMLIVFGHDVNTVEQDGDVITQRLSVILPTISRRLFAPVPTWRFFKLPSDRHFDRCITEVRSWLLQLLADARARAGGLEGEPETSSFLEAMVKATDENGHAYSDDVIASNLFTLLVAGEDTTAHSLAWAIHLLADHPEWAQRIGTEADRILCDATAPADLDAANDLPVASAVANEAMRLKPVAPLMLLEANFDTSIADIEIPRGMIVAILFRPGALADDHFVDARSFQPERWLEPRDGAHDPSAHMPFGSGPRMCPGRSLALIEMNTLLAMLFKNFEVERQGRSQEVEEAFGFVMAPMGLKVRLRPRV